MALVSDRLLAAGLGVITWGVGFPATAGVVAVRGDAMGRVEAASDLGRGNSGKWTFGGIAFLAAIALWLLPMVLMALNDGDAQHRAPTSTRSCSKQTAGVMPRTRSIRSRRGISSGDRAVLDAVLAGAAMAGAALARCLARTRPARTAAAGLVAAGAAVLQPRARQARHVHPADAADGGAGRGATCPVSPRSAASARGCWRWSPRWRCCSCSPVRGRSRPSRSSRRGSGRARARSGFGRVVVAARRHRRPCSRRWRSRAGTRWDRSRRRWGDGGAAVLRHRGPLDDVNSARG